MEDIKKKYILDNQNRKIAVQIDIGVFEKIENVLEDYGLYKLMSDNDGSTPLTLDEAKEFHT